MIEPLFVAAAVVGLLTAAAKIPQKLRALWTDVRGAPESARDILLEVSTISAYLSQLQSFLLDTAEMSRSRTSLLMVEQVLVCLTDCVSTFSELEEILDNLGATRQPMRKIDQFIWAFKEGVISKVLGRLQATKQYLNLMLTILTCASIEEAQASGNKFAMLIRQVLDSNHEMTKRLRALERQNKVPLSSDQSTMEAHDDDGSTVRPSRQNSSIKNRTEFQSLSSTKGCLFTFDQDLQRTRVYSRTARLPDCTFSLSSSAVRSVGWSMLSGLSVSDISNISVLALPISIDELYNGRHFGANHDLKLDQPEEEQPSITRKPCYHLTFKPLDDATDDPCPVIITAALRKHNIRAHSWRYSLYMTHAGSAMVKTVELGELPMRLFRQLEAEGKNPCFELRLRILSAPTVPCLEEYSPVAGRVPENFLPENMLTLTEYDIKMRRILHEPCGSLGSVREFALDDMFLSLEEKDKLSNALRLLSQARQLDDAQDYEGALHGYGSGCGLLQQVMNGDLLYSQWIELRTARTPSRIRFDELRRFFMSNPT